MLTPTFGPALLDPAAMRAAEASAIAAGTPALLLMERAAAACVAALRATAGARTATILCGPGNNGGDGYGIALGLAAAGWQVTVAADAPPAAEPAATLARRWVGPVVPLAEAPPAPVIVDALYGTGLARPLPADVQAALDRLRGAAAFVMAVDVASGLDAATGQALGRPLPATVTVSFAGARPGHVLGEGMALTGRLVVADIGIPVPADAPRLVGPPRLAVPPHDTHKYRRGHVLVVAGDATGGGASGLTALAALRAGAGLVTLAGPGAALPALGVMRRDDEAAHDLLADPRLSAVAIGPGLAPDARSRAWLDAVLAGERPVVIDAGALALADPGAATAPLVLTPHEGEFARLFGSPGHDRIAAVSAAARQSRAVVLLKGAASIIAAPDGRVAVNAHASPWLATAGSGDVLTGIIAALLGQGLAPFEAAQVAAWLHGEAGRRGGPGLIADDVPALLPGVLAAL